MQDVNEETARRILESVLRRLNDGSLRQSAQAVSQVEDDRTRATPVVVILLGDRETGRGEMGSATGDLAAPQAGARFPGCGCQNNSHTGGSISLQSSHPGLERFDLSEEKANRDAPRRCFIEPDRACVGSGACEMRGY